MCLFGTNLLAQNSITLQPGPTDGKDAMISNYYDYLNGNYPNYPYFITNASNSGGNFVYRSLIDFDLSLVPANATISSATLSLWFPPNTDNYIQYSYSPDSNISYLRRVTSNWLENTVTWNNQPTTTTINQIVIPASTSTTQDYPNIDVTSLIQDIVNNKATSFGMEFLLATEQYYRMMIFASSDFSNPLKRPKLVVNWLSPLSCSISKTDVGCFGEYTGKAYVTAAGATSTYSYLWSTGATSDTISNLCSGVYKVTVTSGSFTKVDSIYISQPNQLIATGYGDTNICVGQGTSLQATISGGTLPAFCSWSNGLGFGLSKNVVPNTTTTYYLNAIDFFGCVSSTDSVQVIVSVPPVLNMSGIDTDYCVNAPFAYINATPAGGVLSGTGVSGNLFYPDIAGVGTHTINYTFSVLPGCYSSLSKTTDVHSIPLVALGGLLPKYCWNSPSSGLLGLPLGGLFSGDGVNGSVFNPLAAGIGNHIIIYAYADAFGCSNQDSTTVQIDPIPYLNLGSDTVLKLSHSLTLDAGNGFNAYLWQNASINQTFNVVGNQAGLGMHTYFVRVVDTNNCSNSDTIYINVLDDTGIDISYSQSFKLYPNPSENGIFILQGVDIISLEVFDESGRLILTSKSPIINLSNCHSGAYIVKIITKEGSVNKKILLK